MQHRKLDHSFKKEMRILIERLGDDGYMLNCI